jgi:hypothetical protein
MTGGNAEFAGDVDTREAALRDPFVERHGECIAQFVLNENFALDEYSR